MRFFFQLLARSCFSLQSSVLFSPCVLALFIQVTVIGSFDGQITYIRENRRRDRVYGLPAKNRAVDTSVLADDVRIYSPVLLVHCM